MPRKSRVSFERGIQSYVHHNHDLLEKVILAAILPGVAGAMNASGFFVLGIYTSHMTGIVARIADEVAKSEFVSAFHVSFVLAAFFAGAVVSAALVELGKSRHRGRYLLPLLLEAIALTFFAINTWKTANGAVAHPVQATSLLCFAMGMQNALVTRISGAVVRTTHVTGIVTDLGIETFHVARWYVSHIRGNGIAAWLHGVKQIANDPEFDRGRLHVAIFVSFFSGAVVGPVLYLRYGADAMFVPVVVLVALAVFDASFGLVRRPRGH